MVRKTQYLKTKAQAEGYASNLRYIGAAKDFKIRKTAKGYAVEYTPKW